MEEAEVLWAGAPLEAQRCHIVWRRGKLFFLYTLRSDMLIPEFFRQFLTCPIRGVVTLSFNMYTNSVYWSTLGTLYTCPKNACVLFLLYIVMLDNKLSPFRTAACNHHPPGALLRLYRHTSYCMWRMCCQKLSLTFVCGSFVQSMFTCRFERVCHPNTWNLRLCLFLHISCLIVEHLVLNISTHSAFAEKICRLTFSAHFFRISICLVAVISSFFHFHLIFR